MPTTELRGAVRTGPWDWVRILVAIVIFRYTAGVLVLVLFITLNIHKEYYTEAWDVSTCDQINMEHSLSKCGLGDKTHRQSMESMMTMSL